MAQLTVGISEYIVSRDPEATISTHALGSCIAVVIHDPVAQVGGLLHFMLPESSLDPEKARNHPCMFADTGVPMLFHGAYGLGAMKQRIIVTVLGGAQVLDNDNVFNIGKRNYLALRKILWKAGVMIHQEEVGGTQPRSVRMEVRSGRVFTFYGRNEREITHKKVERSVAAHGI